MSTKEPLVRWNDKVDFNTWFVYDETSPSGLRWKVDRWAGKDYLCRKVARGDVAGCRANNGYYLVRLDGVLYRAHRVIYTMHFGEIAERLVIDHTDGNPSNNIVSNLRLSTQAVNARNSRKKSSNSTGHTGVYHAVMLSGYEYVTAQAEVAGKVVTKSFSVIKLGYELALELAIKARAEMICEFNLKGAEFSTRHGT